MTQTETLELLVTTLQQANTTQSESILQLTRQNEHTNTTGVVFIVEDLEII